MSLRITILGCGASGGVPRVVNGWGSCDPENPRNRRRRCALLVDQRGPDGRTTVLVDTPPDLREQLIDVRLSTLDAVLFTHDHADHTHGIDDLRMIAYAMRRRIPCHMDSLTRESLVRRFEYCFQPQPGSSYPAILQAVDIDPREPLTIHGAGGAIDIVPVQQVHGEVGSLGFRFGNIAYSPDISDFFEGSERLLRGLDVWIVDALRYEPHPSHFHLRRALHWIERLAPKRAVLTHMTAELDYDTLKRELPPHVEPGYDGMVIELAGRARASTAHLRQAP